MLLSQRNYLVWDDFHPMLLVRYWKTICCLSFDLLSEIWCQMVVCCILAARRKNELWNFPTIKPPYLNILFRWWSKIYSRVDDTPIKKIHFCFYWIMTKESHPTSLPCLQKVSRTKDDRAMCIAQNVVQHCDHYKWKAIQFLFHLYKKKIRTVHCHCTKCGSALWSFEAHILFLSNTLCWWQGENHFLWLCIFHRPD